MAVWGDTTTRIGLLAGAGAVFGAVTSVVNASGIHMLPQFLGDGWSWAAIGIAAAALTPRRHTLTVLIVLVAAVAGYYVSDLSLGRYNDFDLSNPVAMADPMHAPMVTRWGDALTDLAMWSACAAVVCWPLARIGAALHRRDIWGLLARLVIPLGALLEVLGTRLPSELRVQPLPLTVAAYLIVVGAAICAIVVLCVQYFHRTRPVEQ
ncbi:hypothetical protein [Humibacter ginsenosidimutans]|uniref:Uncharacterized protein n=1 Tax=Humibacter ginsenosidimutans TaxID=2599293 RepID=A0A5B8M6I7_9MICO|nr:hypothetical protein [Humibacter ginsenosidimutans]QDZ15729.1 hypothetical protein FPZ11_14045 [Humibacter ginsenosidimutans]